MATPNGNPEAKRKLVSVTLSPETAKYLRLFKAHMDWSNEKTVEFAINHLKRSYPDYEILLEHDGSEAVVSAYGNEVS